MKAGMIIRKESAWIGAHYSPRNKRLCLNIVPFITFWFIKKGGNPPREHRLKFARMLAKRIIENGQREND